MKKQAYLLVGVPGSGKSWIASQLKNSFTYVANDDHLSGDYVSAILSTPSEGKPLLIEAPFSVSQVAEPLTLAGLDVVPVYLVESESVLLSRWADRGTQQNTIKVHLARQATYTSRALQNKSFIGNSSQVLEHLKAVVR